MNFLLSSMESANSIAISGHIRPDGDCVGSCIGLYRYIKENHPDTKVNVFLDEIPASFDYLNDLEAFENPSLSYDLFISLDCGSLDRLGDSQRILQNSKKTLNIDHHISNTGFAQTNHVEADASSTCEVLYTLLDTDKLNQDIATALYTGIIHDTGVFKHSNTGKRTMQIAGELIDFGIPFSKIIDDSFYMKNYKQLQIMGRCLLSSIRILDGKCIFAVVSKRILDFYEAKPSDLDGIIDEMRTTEGVEVAILLDERVSGEYKVSMRSNDLVDVGKICQFFGGGGHVKAAGCSIKGSSHDVINNLTEHIEKQLGEQ